MKMKFRRNIVASSKRGSQQINVPKAVSENWQFASECEIEFVEDTSTLIIRPVILLNKAQSKVDDLSDRVAKAKNILEKYGNGSVSNE
jgi:hypothetical protein